MKQILLKNKIFKENDKKKSYLNLNKKFGNFWKNKKKLKLTFLIEKQKLTH